MKKRFVTRALAAGAILVGLATLAAPPAVAQAVRPAARAVVVGTDHNNTADPGQPSRHVLPGPRRLPPPPLDFFDINGLGAGPGQLFAGDGLGAAHSVQRSRD